MTTTDVERVREIAAREIAQCHEDICEKDAEIERLKDQISELQTIYGNLLIRAADALVYQGCGCKGCQTIAALIRELREAAK
jgi:hypothetical protein